MSTGPATTRGAGASRAQATEHVPAALAGRAVRPDTLATRCQTGASGVTIGIDIGGTKVAGAVWAPSRLGPMTLEPTDHESVESLTAQVRRLVSELWRRTEAIDSVGISVAGEVDHKQGSVISASHLPLSGLPLRELLSRQLGLPVIVENDGNCAAIAEAGLSEEHAAEDLVLLTLGTGVGGGVITGGQLLRGRSGFAADLGHIVIASEGPECFGACPGRGCLEALCSGSALARAGEAAASEDTRGALAAVRRRAGRVRAEDVVAAARGGDARASELLAALGRHLGVAICSIVNIFDPREVVIGGGLSEASELYLPAARAEVAGRLPPMRAGALSLRAARSGAHASVLGAAILAANAARCRAASLGWPGAR